MKKNIFYLLIIMIISVPISILLSYIDIPLKKLPIDEVYYSKILNDIPENAVYNGYKVDHLNSKTILYYMFNDSMHTVHIYHPENKHSREVDFYSASHVEYN